MDRIHFPGPVWTLFRGAGIALSVIGSYSTVKYGLQTYSNFEQHAHENSAFPQQATVGATGHDFEPCMECKYVDQHNQLLDYYGRPVDVDELLVDGPSTSRTSNYIPPLTISFATPPTPTSVPTSATDQLPPPSPSNLETLLRLIEQILSLCWSSPFHHSVLSSTNAETPIGTMSQVSNIVWLIVYGFASKFIHRAVAACFQYLRDMCKNRTAASGPLGAEVPIAEGTIAAEDALLAQLTTIIHEQHQDPRTMMSEIQAVLVVRYGDAYTWNLTSGEEEMQHPLVSKDSPNMQIEFEVGLPDAKAQAQEDGQEAAEHGDEKAEEDPQHPHCADGPTEDTSDSEEQDDDIQQSESTVGLVKEMIDLEEEGRKAEAQRAEGGDEFGEESKDPVEAPIAGILEETFQLEDESEDTHGEIQSREVKDLLDTERSRWSQERPEYDAIIERQAEEISHLRSQLCETEQQAAASRIETGTAPQHVKEIGYLGSESAGQRQMSAVPYGGNVDTVDDVREEKMSIKDAGERAEISAPSDEDTDIVDNGVGEDTSETNLEESLPKLPQKKYLIPKDNEFEGQRGMKDLGQQDEDNSTNRSPTPSTDCDEHEGQSTQHQERLSKQHVSLGRPASPDMPSNNVTEEVRYPAHRGGPHQQPNTLPAIKEQLRWHLEWIVSLNNGTGDPKHSSPATISPPAPASTTKKANPPAAAAVEANAETKFLDSLGTTEHLSWHSEEVKQLRAKAARLKANQGAMAEGFSNTTPDSKEASRTEAPAGPLTPSQKRALERKRAKARKGKGATESEPNNTTPEAENGSWLWTTTRKGISKLFSTAPR